MFNFSLSVCRSLVGRTSFRLMCRDFTRIKQEILFTKPENKSDSVLKGSRKAPDYTRPGIAFAIKYLNSLNSPEEVQWDKLTKKLEDMKVNNIPTKIFQGCMRLKRLDLGLRYYNYLVEKGVTLSEVDLLFFSKLLLVQKSEIKNHVELLECVFLKIKDYLYSSILMRQTLMEVFVEVPNCFNDIVKMGVHPELRGGYMPVVEKALELDMLDVAFQYMNISDFNPTASFLEKYVNLCIRKAEEGKFSIDLISTLIDICEEKLVPFSNESLLVHLNALVSVLNKHDSYQWSVHECELNEKEKCSKCGSTLLSKQITDDEFKKLKKCFFTQSFINSNIFLSSTKEELEKFLKFLKTTKPYTLVLDGLNVMYKIKNSKSLSGTRSLKYFLDRGFKVLTIGRKHSENIFKEFSKKYGSRSQCFFTSNLSEDDLFLLYATFHGGPDTFFVSGDYFFKYIARLDYDMKLIFLKWQLSHQYVMRENLELEAPLPHCGISQLTVKTDDTYIWHLSQQSKSFWKLSVASPIQWYCLKATKKKQRK